MKIALPLCVVLAALTFAACGGGGSSTESSGAEPTAPSGGAEGGEEAGGGGEEAGGGGEEAGATLAAGEEVFAENCSVCHGSDGHGGNGGPDLRTMPKAQSVAGAEEQVSNGGGGMPPFKGVLSPEEIGDVATYVAEGING